MYQWKQDLGAAERCCNEALRIDPECEPAVATLAQLSLQQHKLDQAVKLFERQADLARSEPELVNALTYQYVRYLFYFFSWDVWLIFLCLQASAAQVVFMRNYPGIAEQLSALAGAL